MNKMVYIDIQLPTLNEYIDIERSNKYNAANIKKEKTTSIAYIAKEQRFKLDEKKYNVKFTWHKKDNRADHDNICFAKKFILDGLKVAESLKDDSPQYINNFEDIFVVDGKIGCDVEFIEINEIKNYDHETNTK